MNPQAHLWISPVTLAEVLEGAEDPAVVNTYLSRYGWQGIHLGQDRACKFLGKQYEDFR